MKQTDFNLSAFLPYRLAVLSERVSRRLAIEYERMHDLSVAEWRVLVHLLRCQEVSVREIHNCVNLDKPRVSRAVSRLEAAGLVAKMQDGNDARLVAISLTDQGRAALDDILPEAMAVEKQLVNSLTNEELELLCSIMEKLHEVLDRDPNARPRSRMDLHGI